jgi:hypothetical protein
VLSGRRFIQLSAWSDVAVAANASSKEHHFSIFLLSVFGFFGKDMNKIMNHQTSPLRFSLSRSLPDPFQALFSSLPAPFRPFQARFPGSADIQPESRCDFGSFTKRFSQNRFVISPKSFYDFT